MVVPATGRIIKNDKALEDAFPELGVRGREAEIQALLRCLSLASRRIRPLQVWISGPPGSGKTTIARTALERLRRPGQLECIYVNCWTARTLHALVDHAATALRILGVEKIDTRFKLERLRKHLQDKALIVVLDEIDRLPRKEREAVLYAVGDLGNVGVVCISYSKSAFLEMDRRVRSRLSPFMLQLEPYGRERLTQILTDRSRQALHDAAWDQKAIKTIAELAEGDARAAIRTLKEAAHQAESSSGSGICSKHIEESMKRVKDLRRKYVLEQLTPHHELIYQVVSSKGPIASSKARDLYLALCRRKAIKPVARRTFTHYVTRLVELGLLAKDRSPAWGNARVLRVTQTT